MKNDKMLSKTLIAVCLLVFLLVSCSKDNNAILGKPYHPIDDPALMPFVVWEYMNAQDSADVSQHNTSGAQDVPVDPDPVKPL